MIEVSTRATFRYPPSTIHDLLAASIRAYPESPAILAPGRKALTFAELGARLDATAQALADMGLGVGSRIAIAIAEGPESAVALLALCGCSTCAPVDPEQDEQTLYQVFTGMHIDAVIVLAATDSNATSAARRANIAVIELRPALDAAAGSFGLWGDTGRRPVQVARPGCDDVALLMHTSGTTASPKIVPNTHRRLAEAARARIELGAMSHRDRCLLILPLFINTAVRRCLLPSLAVGASVICPDRFDAEQFVEWLGAFAPTYYMASVAAQAAIVEALERRGAPVSHSLRFTLAGGAALSSSVAERLEGALRVPVLRTYGLTETGTVAQTTLPPRVTPARSVGPPANVDILILDDAGRALGVDETGEILVRGPEVFAGYENNPEANAAAFRNGWFRTGDSGHLDRDGFLFVSGRIKDVINRGGAKVAPADVEEALTRHPQVIEATAFALAHPTLGEDVAAAVVLRQPEAATEVELREFSRATLAPFKVPTRIVVVAALPKGSFGKVKRADVARLAQAKLRTEYVAPRDREESVIVKAFAEILVLDRVGILDNFFQLGGDSLRAARVLSQLHAPLGKAIALEALFRQPTAEGLAAEARTAVAQEGNPLARSIVSLPREARRDEATTRRQKPWKSR